VNAKKERVTRRICDGRYAALILKEPTETAEVERSSLRRAGTSTLIAAAGLVTWTFCGT